MRGCCSSPPEQAKFDTVCKDGVLISCDQCMIEGLYLHEMGVMPAKGCWHCTGDRGGEGAADVAAGEHWGLGHPVRGAQAHPGPAVAAHAPALEAPSPGRRSTPGRLPIHLHAIILESIMHSGPPRAPWNGG